MSTISGASAKAAPQNLTVRPIVEEDYPGLYARMKEDFPPGEIPPYASVCHNLRTRRFTGVFLRDAAENVGAGGENIGVAGGAGGEDGSVDVAYAVVTAPPDNRFALINFLAVFPQHRSSGYGGRFLKILAETWADRILTLEVDAPEAAKTEAQRDICLRRIAFYERNGFQLRPVKSVKVFNVAMKLMVNTDGETGSLREMLHSLYLHVLPGPEWLKRIEVEEELRFARREDFRRWLEAYGGVSPGVWLLFGKAGGPLTLKAAEALEEALCFGWIDGLMQKKDGHSYWKYFAPRTAKSKWSAKNKALAGELIKKGLMRDEGLAKIEAAKENGQWEAADSLPRPSTLSDGDRTVFFAQIKAFEPAYTNLMAMAPSVQRTYAAWYLDAKTEAVKARRLAKITDRLNQNLKPM